MDFLDSTRPFLSLTCFFFFIFCCWFVYKYLQFYVWKLPPGPIGLPFLGYVPFIFGKELHVQFHRLRKIYGPLLSVSLGSYSAVVVSDYDNAKELLSHPACLARAPKFFDVLPEKGGFVGMSGDKWQEQRRLCSYALNKMARGSGLWETIIKKDVEELVEYIKKYQDQPMEFGYPLGLSIRSNVMGLLLGKNFSEKDTNPEVQIIEKAFRVVTEFFQSTNPAALMPWLLKWLVKFNIAGFAEKVKAIEEFDSMCRKEVGNSQSRADSTDFTDFIGYYFEACNKKVSTNGTKDYTAQYLIGHLAALFVGGTNSSVASVQWLLVLMAAYPKVQARIHEELDKEITKNEHVRWDDRKKLPYTMATILEMQRWASVVAFFLPRCVTETFEFHGYRLSKGTMIITNGWEIHHDSKYWHDPHLFIPERFTQTNDRGERDPLRSDGYAVFSFGKRNCPGETIAVMTLFLYFTGLMQKFTIKPPPGLHADISVHFSSVIYPKSQDLCFIRR